MCTRSYGKLLLWWIPSQAHLYSRNLEGFHKLIVIRDRWVLISGTGINGVFLENRKFFTEHPNEKDPPAITAADSTLVPFPFQHRTHTVCTGQYCRKGCLGPLAPA